MRPRSLIEFLGFCRSHAINLRHTRIETEDIEQGEEKYSTQLVNNISYEIRDVLPIAANILYEFIECPPEMDEDYLKTVLSKITSDPSDQIRILDLLLWYGVVGFKNREGEYTFIYSVRYDMKKLKALLKKRESEKIKFIINPAFWKGLEIKA
jgi:hypothetical protein